MRALSIQRPLRPWVATIAVLVCSAAVTGACGGRGPERLKASGITGLAAQLFQTLYQTQVPTPPPTPSCPIISSVVTTVSGAAIGPTTMLSLDGTEFSSAGNVVHVVEAGGHQWDVATGSPAWSESPGQIQFTLPAPAMGPSQAAFVTVTDAHGVDSNARALSIGP